MAKAPDQIIIGVTGVIGSGKSLLCEYLRDEMGFYYISADEITHELYKIGQPGYQKIKDYFGPQFVGPQEVYRGRLRQLVLKSQQKLWILNKLMHPLIAHQVNKKIVQLRRERRPVSGEARPTDRKNKPNEKGDLILIESLYFEADDIGKYIDALIIIDAKDEVIEKRLLKRKIPSDQAKKMLYIQRKILSGKPPKAVIIQNNASREALFEEVEKVFNKLFFTTSARRCR